MRAGFVVECPDTRQSVRETFTPPAPAAPPAAVPSGAAAAAGARGAGGRGPARPVCAAGTDAGPRPAPGAPGSGTPDTAPAARGPGAPADAAAAAPRGGAPLAEAADRRGADRGVDPGGHRAVDPGARRGADRGVEPGVRGAADLSRPPEAVLFDRDGTLVADVPYNGDPRRVRPMPTARAALDALRERGVAVGVVTNQSGVARGLITPRQVAAVHRRIEALLGPFDVWALCPHGPRDGCDCRKPAPGLVVEACRRLGVAPARAAVVGDIGADVGAALAAGARALLVPTPATRPQEVAHAPETAPDLLTAVRRLVGNGPPGEHRAHDGD